MQDALSAVEGLTAVFAPLSTAGLILRIQGARAAGNVAWRAVRLGRDRRGGLSSEALEVSAERCLGQAVLCRPGDLKGRRWPPKFPRSNKSATAGDGDAGPAHSATNGKGRNASRRKSHCKPTSPENAPCRTQRHSGQKVRSGRLTGRDGNPSPSTVGQASALSCKGVKRSASACSSVRPDVAERWKEWLACSVFECLKGRQRA
jgi:hypothetical protein